MGFKKGYTPYNKGIPNTPQQKEKISTSLKLAYKEGRKISVSKKGIESFAYKNGKPFCRYCGKRTGSWNSTSHSACYFKNVIPWNKGKKYAVISKERKENHRMRVLFRDTIQKQVFERDNYTCQLCGVKGGNLQVDHIQSWAEYVELRFNIENCRTLCVKCHYQITYGKPIPPSVRAWGHNMKNLKEGLNYY